MATLLTVEQLAAVLHKSPVTIRRDVYRNPQFLPPICRLPGMHRLVWRAEDVDRWLAEHVDGATHVVPPAAESSRREPRKPGRPTKAEQIARRKAKGG